MTYNVFISYKNEDHKIALELYDFLKKNGLSVFFAERTINEADYAELIDRGIEESINLIVITSNSIYLTKGWVKYEWKTFYKEILSGRKDGQLFSIINDDILISDLPLTLRNLQVFKLSEYQSKILVFLKKENYPETLPKSLKSISKVEKIKNRLLNYIPVGIMVVLIFSLFFSVGFCYTHFSERTYDKLFGIAEKNVVKQENFTFSYSLLENEDAYFNQNSETINFSPKSNKTINIYEFKRNEIVENVSIFSVGSIIATLFNTKVKGNSKQTALFYIGGTVAIICGYGLGHQTSLKYFPALESDKMKEFLSQKENWQLITDRINSQNIKR